jgi:protein-disulfide isomerase
MHTGITKNGHPWIGADNPELEIMEFADYQCFQCKKMHFFLRQLVAENPQKVRLVHRHYPMDHKVNSIVKQPFHLGSGALSLISISATSQGRFWEMNDVLYEIDRKNGEIDVREAAQKAGIDYTALARGLKNKNNLLKLLTDIRQGQKLGITGTPAYLIGGKLYLAQIPPDVIKKALR